MADQPGNRAANYPKQAPEKYVEIVENPIKYGEGVKSGGEGGGVPWVSHPGKENQFTIDTLHPDA